MLKTLIIRLTAMLSAAVLLAGCGAGNGSKNGTADKADSTAMESAQASVSPAYARGFETRRAGNATLLTISDPEGKQAEEFRYALVERGKEAEIPEGYTRIDLPVRSVVCMTSLQLSNFIRLGLTDLVSGITSTRHLKNPEMNRRIREGKTAKIGIEGNFDREVIMAINPDVILVSPFKRGGYDAIRDTGVPMIPHLGYKELTPLGQAEWIKVVGLLTGHADEANRAFAEIERSYNGLKDRVDSAAPEVRPTVFSGEMRGGNWYAVGGRSFLAQLFRDAGAEYFLKDNEESGGVTLDYETVYASAAGADYWRIVNSHEGVYDYDAIKASDERYTHIDAWKNHGVIYCNMKEVPFYESMPVEPHVVLADLIAIFHPALAPGHTPVYYHKL